MNQVNVRQQLHYIAGIIPSGKGHAHVCLLVSLYYIVDPVMPPLIIGFPTGKWQRWRNLDDWASLSLLLQGCLSAGDAGLERSEWWIKV